jgi:hypothetical protein
MRDGQLCGINHVIIYLRFLVNEVYYVAICLEFELIEVIGTLARYRFGNCLCELDGLIELDLFKLESGEIPGNTPIIEVVKLMNHKQSQAMANRVFGTINKHYLENNEYPEKGGYYA